MIPQLVRRSRPTTLLTLRFLFATSVSPPPQACGGETQRNLPLDQPVIPSLVVPRGPFPPASVVAPSPLASASHAGKPSSGLARAIPSTTARACLQDSLRYTRRLIESTLGCFIIHCLQTLLLVLGKAQVKWKFEPFAPPMIRLLLRRFLRLGGSSRFPS